VCPTHFLNWKLTLDDSEDCAESNSSSSGSGFSVVLTVRAEISVECRVGGVENQVAVPTLAQVALNLVFNGGREFAL
jgi:hypothetical protein